MSDDRPEQPEQPAGAEPEQSEVEESAPPVTRRPRRRRSVDREAEDLEREARITARIAAQWALLREERDRRTAPPPEPEPRVTRGSSNFSRAQVPWGVDLLAAWSWRLIVIGIVGYAILQLVGYFSIITLPLAIAVLLSALTTPVVQLLQRLGVSRSLSAVAVVLGLLGFVGLLLTFAGQQIANGAEDLATSTVAGLEDIRRWLEEGPLNASDSQIDSFIAQAQDLINEQTKDPDNVGRVTEVGTALGHVLAGLFIVLFATYFFLADGDRIWSWVVRLTPRAARHRVDSSGRVAWISLTQFVRATVIVAAVDAIGISLGAAILGVPFVLAIGVLVFLGAFVPLIGATFAGAVAVLVALVDQGPLTALIMLGVVIGVQQIEAHLLQPFLMGRWVSVHPLAVIIAIAGGVLVAGVAGALVAVPLVAVVNAVGLHLATNSEVGDDPVEQLAEDYEEQRSVDQVGDADDHV
ncbi:AI-2E family transporter [Nocardioides sp.]|uniref:AI-2E family transporter n=1 Tax=Nocardioides sp. TaxID=35761 RepID=UPI002B272AA8|nr:AI-2E family transporter [Nocardioides sp.]